MTPKAETKEKKRVLKADKKANKLQKRAAKKYLEYAASLRGLSPDTKIHPVYFNEIPSNDTVFIEWSDGHISNFRKWFVKLLSLDKLASWKLLWLCLHDNIFKWKFYVEK